MKKWNQHVGKLAFFDKKGMLNITSADLKKFAPIPTDNNYMIVGFDYHYIMFSSQFGSMSRIRKRHVKVL